MRSPLIVVLVATSWLGCGGGGTQEVECPAPALTPTEHSGLAAIATDETWTAAASPHIITGDLRIAMGGTLTIEPCAEVRMRGLRVVGVQEGGRIIAEGTEKRPIKVVPEDPATPWGYVQIFGPKTSRFAYVTFEGGGNEPANSYAALEARGDQLLAAQPLLFVDHVTIKGSETFGVSLRGGATFTADSHDLVVTGSKVAPVRVLPRLVTNLPTGTYTGNTKDEIVVETEAYGDITLEDVTFHDRGVPYLIGGDKTFGELKVGTGSNLVTLTIDPGVTMKFKRNIAAGLVIDTGSSGNPAKGALIAVGTEQKPIVLTSAAEFRIAGDWGGIVFGNRPDPRDKIDWVHVEYAGGPSMANGFHCRMGGLLSIDEDAAITMYGQPTGAFITNSTILSSAGLGINLAYRGMTYNFLATNQFLSVVGCKQSTPKDENGNCPSDVSCP